MEPEDNKSCQIMIFPRINEGYAVELNNTIPRKLRLLIRRSLNVRQVRVMKTKSDRLLKRLRSFLLIRETTSTQPKAAEKSFFQPGDLVRIRSKEEILATLNSWGQLKGCMFMPNEMSQYCNTTQRVLKPMERFVDERDYHVKKSRGVVLLKDVNCQGTTDYGQCDRTCFFFWREEWLEKIDNNHAEDNQ